MTAPRTYKYNSELAPKGFPREFDAHIYFDDSTRSFAASLREKALSAFQGQQVFTGELIPDAVGPHTQPMFEINFPRPLFTDVVLWLVRERGDLSVLVHQLTGDDHYDHTQAALRMGPQVALNYAAL
ncbi:hypothetical protein BV898_10855 [Hypsibius exemplaris]|uniref:DOPA 4,5-dioxygenase n=1 Tax=Hypsibius exemplaris TaxID=2072580 RepID=A0A1W0WIB2_HYPEX|nr:hypothetical protein BV898_10855 [Hypsibius exemplaris]